MIQGWIHIVFPFFLKLSFKFWDKFLDIITFLSSSVIKIFRNLPRLLSVTLWWLYKFQTLSIASSPFEISGALIISPYSIRTWSYSIFKSTVIFLPTTLLMKVRNFLHSLTAFSYFHISAADFLGIYFCSLFVHMSLPKLTPILFSFRRS